MSLSGRAALGHTLVLATVTSSSVTLVEQGSCFLDAMPPTVPRRNKEMTERETGREGGKQQGREVKKMKEKRSDEEKRVEDRNGE